MEELSPEPPSRLAPPRPPSHHDRRTERSSDDDSLRKRPRVLTLDDLPGDEGWAEPSASSTASAASTTAATSSSAAVARRLIAKPDAKRSLRRSLSRLSTRSLSPPSSSPSLLHFTFASLVKERPSSAPEPRTLTPPSPTVPKARVAYVAASLARRAMAIAPGASAAE